MCDCSLVKWLLLGWHFLIFWKSCAIVTSEYNNVVTPHQKTVTQSHSIHTTDGVNPNVACYVSCAIFIYGVK